jgi:hypothetical protein
MPQTGSLDEQHDLGDPVPELVVVADPGEDNAVDPGFAPRE